MRRIIASIGIVLGFTLSASLGGPPGVALAAEMRSTLPPAGRTGAPGEGTCIGCHGDFALNSGNGALSVTAPSSYVGGTTYPVTVTLGDPGQSVWGFEVTALTAANAMAGSFANTALTTQIQTSNSRMYASHTTQRGADGTFPGTADGPVSWTFNWVAPVSGSGNVTFYAAAVAGNGSGEPGSYTYTTTRTTTEAATVDHPPIVTAPATATGSEGHPFQLTVTASDPDADAIASLGATPLPSGATFTPNGSNTSGSLAWTPSTGQAGSYPVTFTASNALSGSASTLITISAPAANRPPIANAGGPYSGGINLPVAFNGSGSSDPDGDALAYDWTFGDGGVGSGATPTHAYASAGTFTAGLTVIDSGSPPLSATASAMVTVTDLLPARAYFSGGNRTTRLASGKGSTAVQLEPVNGSFRIEDVALGSIVMKYAGATISATSDTKGGGDKDANGVQEITAYFSKADLQTLFAGLVGGDNTVTVEFEGDLRSGGRFSASTTHRIIGKSGALRAALSGNPIQDSATLTFVTTKPGPIRVRLFDVSGRLVRTVSDESSAGTGEHQVSVGGRSGKGAQLSSGRYFLRVDAAEGMETLPITIAH